MSDASVFDRLAGLVDTFLSGELSTQDFCERFEEEFNLRSRRTDLEPRHDEIFQALFEEVVLYSPYEDDRAAYPRYRDERAILVAAENARTAIS